MYNKESDAIKCSELNVMLNSKYKLFNSEKLYIDEYNESYSYITIAQNCNLETINISKSLLKYIFKITNINNIYVNNLCFNISRNDPRLK